MTEPRTRGPYPSLRLKPAAVPSLARQERMHKEAQECFHDRRPVAAMQGRRSREDKAKDWPTTEMDRGAIHTRGFILGRMKGYVRCDKIMSKFLAERQARVAVEQELAICKQTRGNQLRVAIALFAFAQGANHVSQRPKRTDSHCALSLPSIGCRSDVAGGSQPAVH